MGGWRYTEVAKSHTGGIQAIAANGPVSLQAHTGQLEILADKAITVISVNDIIDIKANQKITLQAGQSSITLKGGNITFTCPGSFTVKGGQHVFNGGASAAGALPALPDTRIKLFDEGFVLKDRDTGEPMPRQPYRIKREDGSFESGMTDEKGLTHVIAAAAAEALVIELLETVGGQSSAPAPAPSSAPAPVPGSPGQPAARSSTPPEPKYKPAGDSSTTPVDNKRRKEVLVKLPACWIEDYEKEIAGPSYGRYAQPYQHDGTPHKYKDKIWFKLYVPAKTDRPVVVEVRFKAITVLDAVGQALEESDKGTESAALRVKQRANVVALAQKNATAGIEGNWNNKFRLEINDPQCGQKVLPVAFRVLWVDDQQHYTLQIHKRYDRENVTGDVMNVSLATELTTYAHEFGHCVGMPDEYSYTEFEETIRYFKPDGTLDEPIVCHVNGTSPEDLTQSIMSYAEGALILKRHGWNIAIEAQELLSKKIGRKIRCDIV